MPSNDQLWGTFAVDDHTREHAFVAEVVLFDRLVIPEPPRNDKDQYQEWDRAGWQPDLLKDIIDTLGDLAIPVSWDEDLRTKWRTEYQDLSPAQRTSIRMSQAQGASFDAKNIKQVPPDTPAKYITRMVLVNRIKGMQNEPEDGALVAKIKALDLDPTADVETVVGYGSYAKFRRDVPVDENTEQVSAGQDAAFLFKWDFLVPEDSDLTERQLLEKAVELGRKSEFRESRREFHAWRRKLIAKNVSIEIARAEMARCLAIYNNIVEKGRWRSRVSTALQVLTATVPVADMVHPGWGMAGGVACGIGALLWDKLAPTPQVGSREKIAALVHDSREAFGWHGV